MKCFIASILQTEIKKFSNAMNSSDIIAASSLLIAALAFLATAWQAWLAHKHNKLSVRPLLVWHINRRNDLASIGVTYSVRNQGLGPAIIRDRYFTRNDIRFLMPKISTDEVSAFMEAAIGEKVQYHLRTFGLPGKNASIPSQAEVIIAELHFPNITPSDFGVVEKLAEDLNFHIRYESMYKEQFKFDATQKIDD